MSPIEQRINEILRVYLKDVPEDIKRKMQPDIDNLNANIITAMARGAEGIWPEEEIRHISAQIKNLGVIHGLDAKQQYINATQYFLGKVLEAIGAILKGMV